MFQSTLPRRERRSVRVTCMCFSMFQSTLPRRERRDYPGPDAARSVFQSTLPRRERPASCKTPNRRRRVSIHAPAKGATSPAAPARRHQVRFNPRSREGSDDLRQRMTPLAKVFQSTLPRRERPLTVSPHAARWNVSIHAPAKGATLGINRLIARQRVSIHAPVKGATFLGLGRYPKS